MKHLKLFEAKEKKDWIKMIQDIMINFRSILKDYGIDPKDIKDIMYQFTDLISDAEIEWYEYLYVDTGKRTYQFKILNNEKDIIDNSGDGYGETKPWILYSSLSKFEDLLNIKESKLSYVIRLYTTYTTNTELEKEIDEELKGINKRLESSGLKLDTKWWEPEIIDTKKTSGQKNIDISIHIDMDKSDVKIGEKEWHKNIPKNILDRFNDFVARKNLSEKDKEELSNIIKDIKL